METIIKIRPSELNVELLNKLKDFIGKKKNIELTISLREYDAEYAEALGQSVEQANEGKVISMTMEEFINYAPKSVM